MIHLRSPAFLALVALLPCACDPQPGAGDHGTASAAASTATDPATASASGTATTAAGDATTGAPTGAGPGGLPVEERDGKIKIPAGPFRMGCDPNDRPSSAYLPHPCDVPGGFASLHNVPAREITLTYDYWIDKTELTRQDFAECATAGPCAREQPFIADSQTFPGLRLYPMGAISWDEAKTLCEWRGGRLPTEVEWEKAARGPDFRYLPWGNADPECDTTNAILPRDCGYDAGERGTTQVDAHPKDVSPYGVLNMAGSVSEWVVDFPDPDYYATMAAVDPRPPDGPTEVPGKSMRGGWTDSGPYIIYRQYLDDAGTGSVGVRCVYDQLPPPG